MPIVFKIEGKSTTIPNLTFPLIRGCSARMDTESLKICTEDKVSNFIKSGFNLVVARANLPEEKTTKFLVTFNINKKGKVVNVGTKSQNKAITKEAIRVTKKLPKFLKPGYHKKKTYCNKIQLRGNIKLLKNTTFYKIQYFFL